MDNPENKEQKKGKNKNNKNNPLNKNKKENNNISKKDNLSKNSDNNKNINVVEKNINEGDIKKNQNSVKSNKLQEKLKKIFLEREKAKYKYNKQLIPEQLKYNSEDEESNLSEKKDNNSIKKLQIKTTENFFNYKIKSQIINLKNKDNDKDNNNEDNKNENINVNKEEIITVEKKEIIKNEKKENIKIFEKISDKKKNNENNKIKNKKRFRNINNDNNEDSDEYKQKYYKLLNSKTVEEIHINDKKIIEPENKEKNIDKTKEKKDDVKIEVKTDSNNELLSRSLGDIRVDNNKKEESNNLEVIKVGLKLKSNREKSSFHKIDNTEKKNVLKLLELIKSKKSERELIVQKKEEIRRSRSLVGTRTVEKLTEEKEEEKDNKKDNKKDNHKDIKMENIKVNTKNNNKDIKPILVGQQIYKKNPKSHKMNSSYKKNNFLSEENSKRKENQNKITLAPLNINIENINLSSTSDKNNITNKFTINNRLKNKNENLINKTEETNKDTFYKTSNQIKPIKKYEKPKISSTNIFNSTIYFNKSLSKHKRRVDDENDNIHNKKYHESIIYSPKKNRIKKIKSENHFTKKNNLDNNININNNNDDMNNSNNYSNYYIKKKTLLNENKNLSKSNYNIYSNFPNIHNYYNNSKIYLKNKFISIHPSFSINNNLNNNNNNNIDEIEIKSNSKNENVFKNNKIKEGERNHKANLKKFGSGFINNTNKGGYIYYKNKIITSKNRNTLFDKSLPEKYLNESINTETNTGKIEDINYEYLPLGTEEMTYTNNNNKLKNEYLNLADSYLNAYPENNTLYESKENKKYIIEDYNQIYINKKIRENKKLNQSSPYYQKKIKKINITNTLNDMNYKRNYRLNNNNSVLINIENILIFEEKFSIIILHLRNNLDLIKPCLDFWNYYFNSFVSEKIEKIFDDEGDITILKMNINYLLLSVMICYYFSLKKEIFNNINYLLLQLLELNYNSIMLIFLKINNTFLPENKTNKFLPIISSIYINYIKASNNIDNSNLMIIEKIYNNIENIDYKIKNILTLNKKEFFKILYNFYFNIRQKDYKEINEFFINYILNEENINGSLFSSNYFINNNLTFTSINPPYLKSPNKKKLTLILDLNDTLINFKYEDDGEGYVRIRPFLFGFLEEISQLYELIVFTSSEKEFADSIIEAIEHERTYFDHVFYRQHTIIVGNDFVKDLTKIGRPLNSTIIIDNMPQNFKLQKENGILIKPFWGEDSKDRTLYDLMPILLDIAKDGGDVRYGLNKYRNEIIGKISSNILKKSFND